MKDSSDVTQSMGLTFFGKISASISHELKNCLSIINESAGLLEDLVLIAQKGSPIDPGRLLTTSKRIQQQVARADRILQNMNRFSHSTDHPLVNIDIQDLLSCLLDVTKRITDMKGVAVSYSPGETPMMINTNPFGVMMFIWQLLQLLIENLKGNKNIGCEAKKTGEGVTVGLCVPGGVDIPNKEGFLEETALSLKTLLGATVSVTSDGFLLLLTSRSN
jgi:hypothetical protein